MFNNIITSHDFAIHAKFSGFEQSYLNNHQELLNAFECSLKNCNDIQTDNIMLEKENEDKVEGQNSYFSKFIQRFKQRLIILPPLYILYSSIKFNDHLSYDFEVLEMDYMDILINKRILDLPETEFLKNTKLSFSDQDNLNKISNKINIWDDKILKEIVSKRSIDVVLNLNSFVKLILSYLKELKQDCYLPFLKIDICQENKNCIIFDKIITKITNNCQEQKRCLKYCLIQKYIQSENSNNQSPLRIVKLNNRIKGITNTNVFEEFISGISTTNNVEDHKVQYNNHSDIKFEKCCNVKNEATYEDESYFNNSMDGILSIDCDMNTSNSVVHPEKESHKYSYGIWKLKNRKILFRYKNYNKKVIDPVITERKEFVHTCFQIKSESNNNDIEDLWKSFIGSKLNLHSGIIRIIMDLENEIIDDVISEDYVEFLEKNPSIKLQYDMVLRMLINLFDELLSEKLNEPDFYLLHLSNANLKVYKSTDNINEKDLDLRDIENI